MLLEEADFELIYKDDWEYFLNYDKVNHLFAWKIVFNNNWYDVGKSSAFMTYYFSRGIPDRPYFLSPGLEGQSVQYFPYFKKEHFILKDAFDYFSDVFFFKCISSYENLWQIINIYYSCGLMIKGVSHKKICERLKVIENPIIADFYMELVKDDLIEALNMRHSIAHRMPTGAQASGVQKKENAILVGISEYVDSEKTMAVAQEFINFSIEAIQRIRDFVK